MKVKEGPNTPGNIFGCQNLANFFEILLYRRWPDTRAMYVLIIAEQSRETQQICILMYGQWN